MIAFNKDYRCFHGVGPICLVLEIAPSTYYAFKAVACDPALVSDRAKQDQLDTAVTLKRRQVVARGKKVIITTAPRDQIVTALTDAGFASA